MATCNQIRSVDRQDGLPDNLLYHLDHIHFDGNIAKIVVQQVALILVILMRCSYFEI